MASGNVEEIMRADIQSLHVISPAKIRNVKYVSSYNWIQGETPTICVPGSPPLWTPRRGPQHPPPPPPDTGFAYISQNAGRLPESPLEPLIRSVLVAQPAFDLGSVDVVSDRNNIRKLLAFVNPAMETRLRGPFAIRIEMAKGTAIFCRDDPSAHEVIRPDEFRGYGHEFEKAHTTSAIAGSAKHHRIIQYSFCDMTFLIRHETDGYIGGDSPRPKTNKTADKQADLATMLGTLSLSGSVVAPGAPTRLEIQVRGGVVPLESTLDIKTRSSSSPLSIRDIASQLWVSQTPNLVMAYHTRGVFAEPVAVDVAAEVRAWESANGDDLARLGVLIRRLVDVCKSFGGQVRVTYGGTAQKLVVTREKTARMLPDDLYERW